MTKIPARILTIAGSDSSGGAGIQADIKTITMLGGYAMSAITAITAQNSLGVSAVEVLSVDLVTAQIAACVSDIGVDAVKIGMLGSAAIAHAVADALEPLDVPVVFDPVMISTSGSVLADRETVAAFERLMALAALTTPNLPELEALALCDPIKDEAALADAVQAALKRTGGKAMLAKGGHWPGGQLISRTEDGRTVTGSSDSQVFDHLFTRSAEGFWNEWTFHHDRIATRHMHGTGCTMASAAATRLGQGASLPDAVRDAAAFVYAALRSAPGFGAGNGPLGHQAVRGVT